MKSKTERAREREREKKRKGGEKKLSTGEGAPRTTRRDVAEQQTESHARKLLSRGQKLLREEREA